MVGEEEVNGREEEEEEEVMGVEEEEEEEVMGMEEEEEEEAMPTTLTGKIRRLRMEEGEILITLTDKIRRVNKEDTNSMEAEVQVGHKEGLEEDLLVVGGEDIQVTLLD